MAVAQEFLTLQNDHNFETFLIVFVGVVSFQSSYSFLREKSVASVALQKIASLRQ